MAEATTIIERLRGRAYGPLYVGADRERCLEWQAKAEIERLQAKIQHINHLASIAAPDNWKDIILHVERLSSAGETPA